MAENLGHLAVRQSRPIVHGPSSTTLSWAQVHSRTDCSEGRVIGERLEAMRPNDLRLCGQTIVVLNAAQHGQRNELPLGWRRLPQLGIRVRDSVNRLRRPCSIVVFDERGNDLSNVLDAKEDEVVQGVFT